MKNHIAITIDRKTKADLDYLKSLLDREDDGRRSMGDVIRFLLSKQFKRLTAEAA